MMEHHNNVHFQDQEEVEDTLSFSEPPILINAESEDNELSRNQAQEIYSNSNHSTPIPPSPITDHQPPELFEFFVSSDSIMCSAEDVIFCGKQSAFRQRSDSLSAAFKDKSIYSLPNDDHKRKAAFRRRSDSSPELRSRTKTKPMIRNSQSLDYRKFHPPGTDRNSSLKGVVKSDMPLKVAAAKTQPLWSSLRFGILKVSGEMEISEFKSRQFQKTSSNKDAGRKLPVSQSSGEGYWRFLEALTCNNLGSVAVTASLFEP